MSGIAEYRRRTQARHRPVVAVASAPEVDACLARSGLTLVDALRPWSDVRGISFSVRLNPESGYPHVLNEFGVRFHDARECARVPDAVADAHAAEALTPWSPADAHGLARALEGVPSNVPSLIAHARGEDGMTNPGDKPTGVRDGTNREKVFAAPWLDAYHARFDRAMQFADHEAVDHPVGIVYAVMANTPGEDPAEAYRRLAEDPTLFPPVLRDTTLADADVPRHCLLVHDASSPSAPTDADLDALRTSMQNSIGAAANGGVFVLPVNGAREPVTGRADAWTPHVETRLVAPVGIEPGTVGSSPRGAYLSDEDVERHKVFVAELVNMSLLPSMDRRAKSLNAVIIANRKGLKNQLKSFWGRSTGQIVKPEGDGGYARYASFYLRMRNLTPTSCFVCSQGFDRVADETSRGPVHGASRLRGRRRSIQAARRGLQGGQGVAAAGRRAGKPRSRAGDVDDDAAVVRGGTAASRGAARGGGGAGVRRGMPRARVGAPVGDARTTTGGAIRAIARRLDPRDGSCEVGDKGGFGTRRFPRFLRRA